MSGFWNSEVVAAVGPHLLWVVVFLVVLPRFLDGKTLADLLSRASKIQVGGFSVDLVTQVEAKLESKKVPLTPRVKAGVVDSLERLSALATGARILWIDPHPRNNTVEIRSLTRLGAAVDLARSDDEAETSLDRAVYDVVLSNMTRKKDGKKDERAGETFLKTIRSKLGPPPVIFYTGVDRGTPEDAFGLTTRPDELFRLILQALERTDA